MFKWGLLLIVTFKNTPSTLPRATEPLQQGGFFSQQFNFLHETRTRLFILFPGHSRGTNPGMLLGGSSSSQPSTDDTSPSLGALISPSFRSAWHQPLWEIFSICPSALAPAKQEAHTKSPFLVNRTAVLYSSPLAGSSAPRAVTPFLQQADEDMSKEKLFSCLVYACKKPFRQPNTYQPQNAAALFSLPAWCYQ